MPRIPREVIEHHLKIYPNARLVQQKPQKQSIEWQNFIREEIKKLLDAGFIREVDHPRWLANPIVVPKAGGKLQMCIDYTSLNKTCSKDAFPHPRIDQIVDSTSDCDLLCFLDAYSDFQQIPMSRENEEHTAFIRVDGLFCYVSMAYALKNALPTFVRAMHKAFGDLIRDLIEVYVDDIIVKIKSRASLLDNLAQVFHMLRSTRTKLNPEKCVFEVTTGKLLSFLVSYRGIETNLEKIRTIEAMRPPACIKDVQKLTGCLAVLSWSISRLAERALPFFKLLRNSRPFVWTDGAEEAFQELKRYLTSSPVMVAPEPGEPLLLYIAATTEAVSMVLVAERSEPPQPQETKEASANGLGSQGPEPAGSPEVGSQPGPSSRRRP
jgi:dsDNA-binding SOS-regulon protein